MKSLSGVLLLILISFILTCTPPITIKINKNPDRHIPTVFTPTYDINDNYTPVYDLSSFPGPDNTGIKGADLTTDDLMDTSSLHIYDERVRSNDEWISDTDPRITSGRIQIASSSIIIERLNVDDGIYIYDGVESVTIRQCRIVKGTYGVQCNQSSTDVIIEDCTFTNNVEQGVKNDYAMRKAILARNCTIRRCDISNYADAIYLTNNVTVKDCYIHDLYHYDPVWDNPDSTEDSTHSDGIQTSGGGNYLIRHNTIDSTGKNSAIMFTNHYNDIGAILIDNNYMLGGNYTVYVTDSALEPYIITDAIIRNNIFYHEDPRRAIAINTDTVTVTGNRLTTGEPVE